MKKKLDTKTIIKSLILILLPLGVGGVSAALASNAMANFSEMKQPPLSPPGWLFPVAWTILYLLMGIASVLIWRAGVSSRKSDSKLSKKLMVVYFTQLIFNFCWSPVFFNFKWYWFALGWLLLMWAEIIYLAVNSRKLNKKATLMLVPYILWTTFAAYLNLGIALLN